MTSHEEDILATKLHVPRTRSSLVRRNRLLARLDEGLSCVLTLLCAPAGFGKTSLLVDWLSSRGSCEQPPHAVAWLSLDEGDNDPARFLRLFVTALRAAGPPIGETVLAMIRAPQLPPIRRLMTIVINEFLATRRDVILILEDYHVIRNTQVQEAVTFLLEHLPPLLHVAIATREDPPLLSPRLRAGGAVCELRAADLRFTAEEIGIFFRQVVGLPLSAEDAEALEARTEGWIAALQLASLSVPSADVSGFIATVTATHRYLLDYLRDEVLARQPAAVQKFLLHTSLLDRLSGPLCDAVLGGEQPDATQSLLEDIERRNLFLIPLDVERRWYRYHHLFANLLRVHLQQSDPALAAELHSRASDWYERHGLVYPAVHHALAASDLDRTARLVERYGIPSIARGELQAVLGWCQEFPASELQSRPRLSIVYALALGLTNQLDRAETQLQNAEKHLPPGLGPDEKGSIIGRIVLLRSMMRVAYGDLERTVVLAAEALDLLPPADVEGRTIAQVFATHAFRASGDATSATEDTVTKAAERAEAARLPTLMRTALSLLARLYVRQGRLRRAAAVFTRAEDAVGEHVLSSVPICSFGYGELLREWNDLAAAERYLTRGVESIIDTNAVDAYVAAEGYVSLARLRQARGDSSGATAVLDAFTVLASQRNFRPRVRAHVAAARAHLWLMQGNHVAAAQWAARSGLGTDDPISYVREMEYCVLARVLIAKKSRAVPAMLDRLLEDAEKHERMGSAIEILVLTSLAWQALGDRTRASSILARALALGEPEGYVRVFVDEGAPMASLLRRAHVHGIAPEYAALLLAILENRTVDSGSPFSPMTSATAPDVPQPPAPSPLLAPLTEREREVLRLIAAGASNQEIGQRLVVSTVTVKTHIYHIFDKLGVRSRTQAAARAKALHLD